MWSLVCDAPKPPKPSTKDVWLPPGKWVPWDATKIFDGNQTLTGLQFKLSEIPLFAKAGAVVPLQTMAKAKGPLVWNIWPVLQGDHVVYNGSSYADDGTTQKYKSSTAAAWTTSLWHTTAAAGLSPYCSASSTSITAAIAFAAKGNSSRKQVLQLRRQPGTVPPTKITCEGKELTKIAAPASLATLSANAVGYWIATESSLEVQAGAIMIALPVGAGADVKTSVCF